VTPVCSAPSLAAHTYVAVYRSRGFCGSVHTEIPNGGVATADLVFAILPPSSSLYPLWSIVEFD